MEEFDLDVIINDLERSFERKQFYYNIMLVGPRGCGKTTLLNTLFCRDLVEVGTQDENSQLSERTFALEEGEVRLRLRSIESRFELCASADKSPVWKSLVNYIDSKFAQYLEDHYSGRIRSDIEDSRVHCCLYLIMPTGPFNQLDIDCLRALHEKVNVIPVIAKSDCLTPEECQRFKRMVASELERHQIKTYKFPALGDEEYDRLKDLAPFAVIGSNYTEKRNGDITRVRKYYHGTVDVYDPKQCDVLALSKLLIRFHMADVVDSTHCVHYLNFVNDMVDKKHQVQALDGGGDAAA